MIPQLEDLIKKENRRLIVARDTRDSLDQQIDFLVNGDDLAKLIRDADITILRHERNVDALKKCLHTILSNQQKVTCPECFRHFDADTTGAENIKKHGHCACME